MKMMVCFLVKLFHEMNNGLCLPVMQIQLQCRLGESSKQSSPVVFQRQSIESKFWLLVQSSKFPSPLDSGPNYSDPLYIYIYIYVG